MIRILIYLAVLDRNQAFFSCLGLSSLCVRIVSSKVFSLSASYFLLAMASFGFLSFSGTEILLGSIGWIDGDDSSSDRRSDSVSC